MISLAKYKPSSKGKNTGRIAPKRKGSNAYRYDLSQLMNQHKLPINVIKKRRRTTRKLG